MYIALQLLRSSPSKGDARSSHISSAFISDSAIANASSVIEERESIAMVSAMGGALFVSTYCVPCCN